MFVILALILALVCLAGCGLEISNLRQNRTALKKTIDVQKRVMESQTVSLRKLKIENDRLHETNGMINDAAIKQAANLKVAMLRGDGAIDRVSILLETVDDLNAKIRELTKKKVVRHSVDKNTFQPVVNGIRLDNVGKKPPAKKRRVLTKRVTKLVKVGKRNGWTP